MHQDLTENFSDMPKFAPEDIQSVCRTMHRYLFSEAHKVHAILGIPLQGEVQPTDAEALAIAAPKRTKLLARTTALVEKLEGLGKLESGAPFSASECANHTDPKFDELNKTHSN